MCPNWEDRLGGFALALPTLVAERDMQRRMESKFVMPVWAAEALLPALADDYAALPAGAALVAAYRSLYFDTCDLDLFHAHRRGRRIRQKVRIRHYPDRRLSFLEVKLRIGDGVTSKVRRQRAYGDNPLSTDERRFVHAYCAVRQELLPQAWIDYQRITLLGTRTAERVTIDFDLVVARGPRGGRLQDVAVVEVKQVRLDRSTAAMRALREAGWRTGWASKYCAAIALTSPEVRAHRLLEGLRGLKAVGAWAN